jgi:succinyl-CoA synthetase beta subunit/citryl-CoA synthetase large subunit
MRFYEFETKTILARRGISVPEGSRAANAGEAASAARELGGALVVKAQLLVGSKAGASRSDESQAVDSPEQAATATEELLKIDDGGRGPKGVLVEKVHAATAEYSLSISYDGTAKQPLLLAADIAGNIEDIAEAHPDRVVSRHFSALVPFSDYVAKEVAAGLGLNGSELNRMAGVIARLARLFLDYDLTQADIQTLARLEDGSLLAVDCFSDMEVEAKYRQKELLAEFGVGEEDTRSVRAPTAFELAGKKIDDDDPRGIIGPVVEFSGNVGLVIGAGGGSLTLTDAVRKAGGDPANYAAIGGNPSVAKAVALTKLVLGKPGVDKIAVMSNVVSNTRADLVARGVIKGVIEMGFEPADKITIFRVPGAWEADAVKILNKYGVEYCDRSVSMSEAAKRAVDKING